MVLKTLKRSVIAALVTSLALAAFSSVSEKAMRAAQAAPLPVSATAAPAVATPLP